jgi:glycyl-tRNA synthetase beta chain
MLTGIEARRPLGAFLKDAAGRFEAAATPEAAPARDALHGFLSERLEFALAQRGATAQAVRAVVRGRPIAELCPLDVKRNVAALQEFVDSEAFRKLGEAFKRVRNIARELKDAAPASDAALRGSLKDPAELALLDEIAKRGQIIQTAVDSGREYRAAYAEAAQFQPAVDRFFTEVFVMVDDAPLRQARLGLMKRLEQLILQLGDISEIVAPES